ncbi:hypothetical protein JDV02_005595 [Purpureocillium takamizusanense]|uniref:Cytochrome P450 n=1 Tax=Purpureocillium takamizusanense TaxID=2060973 RepID=A0A9Q8QID5_9HYPO|nr:uncharacterized protein JDV02_005595 [Purpureocillium takamizusanense]UNI19411.1 hypothetical protein JDV02_005595 [Purpureocillium takamizusanense]
MATSREAVCDTTIQGQVVPKGTYIVISPWGTNVDRSLWGHDAGEFSPERWLSPTTAAGSSDTATATTGSGGAKSNYAFLTFLHGPRSCIGADFARAELACLLAA